jgi:hypothetical protein
VDRLKSAKAFYFDEPQQGFVLPGAGDFVLPNK